MPFSIEWFDLGVREKNRLWALYAETRDSAVLADLKRICAELDEDWESHIRDQLKQ